MNLFCQHCFEHLQLLDRKTFEKEPKEYEINRPEVGRFGKNPLEF